MKRFIYLVSCLSVSVCFLSSCDKGKDVTAANPADYLKNDDQKAMVSTLKDLADGHIYSVEYSADYCLDEIMESRGASSSVQLLGKAIPRLTTVPLGKSGAGLDFGCSAFCVRSPEGDVLVGRNFDYRFVSSSNMLVHNVTKGARESICISALPFLDKDVYVAGALSDGKTDLSIPVTASIYCCLDGMNDAGLFIGVLSLRGTGGAVQHDSKKSDIVPTLAIRLALDGCTSVDEAVEVFRSHNFFADGENSDSNYHFLIADASGKSVVVEYYRPGEVPPLSDPAAKDWSMNLLDTDHVTNFYLSEGWQNVGGGRERYDKLHETLEKKNRVMTEDECMSLLDDVHTDLNSEGGDITSNTQWSVVYNLTKKTATICVDKDYKRRIPYNL
ncbi:MAG TPA: hypothetical protein DDX40_06515 [Rikenellaceae bacterium]|nr:hypothetical protein [Rikenellaceae bacterium]